jgi:type II secretory pathway pseudopilin PulG
MAKFWKVVKVIIFIWGALTLALVLYGLLAAFVVPLFKGQTNQQATASAEETVLEKKEGSYKLLVKQKESEGTNEYLLTLSKDDQPLVRNYILPTLKYKLEYINIYDATILPGRENECRIVLYSVFADDENQSEGHVWFLKSAATMTVREVISLSDVHQSVSDGLLILGNKRFGMPNQKTFRSEGFVVPIMIQVGNNISVSTLLSSTGADALRRALDQEIKARLAALSDDKENKHGEQYQKVKKEMSEALSEKVIAY